MYHAKSKIELKRVLKIHPETCKIYIYSNLPYLNKFILLSFPIHTASTNNNSVVGQKFLLDIMHKERQDMYMLGARRSIPVILEIKEGNTFLTSWGQTINFDSLTSCIKYLRGLGLIIKRDTLSKYIKIEKVFHNFLCKYSNKNLPDNFKEVGLIIDEYKKLKVDTKLDLLKVNIQKKQILVKGDNFEKEFESITDTIKFFNTLNIKLDRKTLNLHLKNGLRRKLYKCYYFIYK